MNDLAEKIVSLAKRRGFVFLSSEIYGGFGSCYDFGPLGVELKNNIKKAWWQEMVRKREDVVGLDASILMSPKVWQASGHLSAGFADELKECKKCRNYRSFMAPKAASLSTITTCAKRDLPQDLLFSAFFCTKPAYMQNS